MNEKKKRRNGNVKNIISSLANGELENIVRDCKDPSISADDFYDRYGFSATSAQRYLKEVHSIQVSVKGKSSASGASQSSTSKNQNMLWPPSVISADDIQKLSTYASKDVVDRYISVTANMLPAYKALLVDRGLTYALDLFAKAGNQIPAYIIPSSKERKKTGPKPKEKK